MHHAYNAFAQLVLEAVANQTGLDPSGARALCRSQVDHIYASYTSSDQPQAVALHVVQQHRESHTT